jgi:hypothetical protein
VSVVTAGVHLAGMLRGKFQTGIFLNGQGIKVRPQGNGLVAHNYPVAVEAGDVVTVFVTVLAVGFMAVWLPVRLLTRKFI